MQNRRAGTINHIPPLNRPSNTINRPNIPRPPKTQQKTLATTKISAGRVTLLPPSTQQVAPTAPKQDIVEIFLHKYRAFMQTAGMSHDQIETAMDIDHALVEGQESTLTCMRRALNIAVLSRTQEELLLNCHALLDQVHVKMEGLFLIMFLKMLQQNKMFYTSTDILLNYDSKNCLELMVNNVNSVYQNDTDKAPWIHHIITILANNDEITQNTVLVDFFELHQPKASNVSLLWKIFSRRQAKTDPVLETNEKINILRDLLSEFNELGAKQDAQSQQLQHIIFKQLTINDDGSSGTSIKELEQQVSRFFHFQNSAELHVYIETCGATTPPTTLTSSTQEESSDPDSEPTPQ